MHNRQAITLPRLWNALCDYDLWPIYLIGLIAYTPMVPVKSYITLTLKDLGFNTVRFLLSSSKLKLTQGTSS